ncbi:protein SSUH2 homolog isoform X2 [Bufo gargarizans]|uniref:protein SSUH2 homolog isoform X2 n=1 Tax=Bufo gargarizans TaxID=30331 RepID=UPI001CF19577|nr:protein SSUH2 homolog isoform X2 [Bufo gargarizans]
MDESGSELHPAGSSDPEAPVSVTTLKDDKSNEADCPNYEDLEGSELQQTDGQTSVIDLKDDESQGEDCPKSEELNPGPLYRENPVRYIGRTPSGTDLVCIEKTARGFSDLNAPITIQSHKENESEGTDCPKYEDIKLDGEFEPPPPYLLPDFPPGPVRKPITIPTSLISEDAARQALLEYATKKWCYSTGPARQMILRDFQPFNTFRYRLDTFTETRICKWVSEPHFGGEVDGPENGLAPNAWDLPAEPPCLFRNAEYCRPLPHTASVQTCSDCGGRGRNTCIVCYGAGRRTCASCGGCGRSNNQMCFACSGVGRNTCISCGGSGYQQCFTCSSQGEVVRYILLTVKWENHNFEFIADHKSDFKSKRFKKVTGENIFSDEQQMVTPVTSFPEPSISEASGNVISQHRATFTNSKILQQRHSIEWLPLTRVTYTWHNAEYDYYVYGTENKAYAKNYPRKCCCTIM